jgi:hypothetical protein
MPFGLKLAKKYHSNPLAKANGNENYPQPPKGGYNILRTQRICHAELVEPKVGGANHLKFALLMTRCYNLRFFTILTKGCALHSFTPLGV